MRTRPQPWHSGRFRAAGLGLMTTLAIAAAAAGQAPAGLDVSLEGPDDCPPAEQLRAQIADLVGRAPDDLPPPTLVIVAKATRDSDGVHMLISLQRGDERSERELRGDSCAQASRALVLMAALTIDPEATARRAQEVLPPAAETPAEPADTGDTKQPPEPKPPEPRSSNDDDSPTIERAVHHFHLWADAFGDLGSLPGVSPGLALAIGAAPETLAPVYVEARANYLPAVRESLAAGAAVDFELWSAGLTACHPWQLSRALELGACGNVAVGQITGTAQGELSQKRSVSALWALVGVGLNGRYWVLSWLGLQARLEFDLPVVRTPFRLEGEGLGQIHLPEPVIFRGGLGLVAGF